MEKIVNSISFKLQNLELKVSTIDNRVQEVEKCSSYISDQFENQSAELKTTKDTIKNVQDSCTNLQGQLKSLEAKHESFNVRVLDGEYRDMRDNVILYGIPEQQQGTEHGADNSDALAKEFITKRLGLAGGDMELDRAHRLGHPERSKKPMPIIVKFHRYKDREDVRAQANSMRNDLKSSNHGVGVQIPKEWRDAPSRLYSIMQAERLKGNRVRMVADKLYINGQQYKPPTITGQ